jgi:hypothetical protein
MKKMAETIYFDGIKTFKPHENAPDFVKGNGVIAINPLVQFFKENPSLITEYKGEPQIKFQITDGKYGLAIVVDAWRPNETNSTEGTKHGNNDKEENDLPF